MQYVVKKNAIIYCTAMVKYYTIYMHTIIKPMLSNTVIHALHLLLWYLYSRSKSDILQQ